jgi:hypothetical protein
MNNLAVKVQKIKEFNMVVMTFLKQIENVCDISYIDEFKRVIDTNSTLPIDKFVAYVIPVREKIINKDDSYFYDEYQVDTDNENILSHILKLKHVYSKLDDVSKNSIWDFFQAMLIISEEYLILKIDN